MALEDSIEALTETVTELLLAVKRLTKVLDSTIADVTPAPEEIEPAPTPKLEKKSKGSVDPTAPDSVVEHPITQESLRQLCLDIVRCDRENSPKVKAVIASFDGALRINDVPTNKLPELAKQLLALTS